MDPMCLVLLLEPREKNLFTTSGQMLKCARIANGASFPYCSAFGVSPSGMLMACDRANSRMVLFRFGEESVSEDAVITDDVFDRMMGESGVENEIPHTFERAAIFLCPTGPGAGWRSRDYRRALKSFPTPS
ncbi:hypothetical protein OSTOST_25374 [Ostertagia ostertagi]